VSPATVAAAYGSLAVRGLVSGEGRRGTRVAAQPPLLMPDSAPVPEGLRNLADGNPDPALLPGLEKALRRLDARPRLYGGPRNRAELVELARRQLETDGLPAAEVAVVGGAMDAIERVLQAHLRPGDRVAVEDPGYTGVLDLVGALGLVPAPVPIDDSGPTVPGLETALVRGVQALVITPRAQNPTGAALTPTRARSLARVLGRDPSVLLIEDDHAGPVAGAPAETLVRRSRTRWAHVRSVSKWLGPDLRVAVMTGDPTTVARVEGRLHIGSGWVSHLLQATAASLWSDRYAEARLRRAATAYANRRDGLIEELGRHGIAAHGRSGMNVWVPVPAEEAVLAAMAARGWALRGGERYRLESPPAVRITVSTLSRADARRLAADLAAALASGSRTRTA
jgi:DNA-binding transcriptional MocR family regulator